MTTTSQACAIVWYQDGRLGYAVEQYAQSMPVFSPTSKKLDDRPSFITLLMRGDQRLSFQILFQEYDLVHKGYYQRSGLQDLNL